jgi:fermentation-respiration switch protein FrsA (DUF1100 family)
MRRFLVALGLSAVVLYGSAVGYLALQETQLVFSAGRPLAATRPAAPFEHVDLPRADGLRQFAWVMRHPEGPTAPWVLYLHGNSATVASRVNILRYEGLRSLRLNVLAPEYRGFGGLDGVPSEEHVTRDARAAYDFLRERLAVPADRIIVFGWSLGSAIAVNLAAGVPSAALVLEGAPASLVAIGARDYPWMPVRLVMRNPFESILKVPRIRAPMLFLHSPDDRVIPIDEGRRLFGVATGIKEFVEVRGGHIDAAEVDRDRYFGAIRTFLDKHVAR